MIPALSFHNAVFFKTSAPKFKLISPANHNYLHLFHLFIYVVIFVVAVKMSDTAWY